jgi:hypothetical protein
MSEEKIGTSVLGYNPSSVSMSPKKRRELETKVKEELAKKKQKDEEEEKLPKLTIPGDSPPEPIPGNADWDKMVHVDEHYRNKPKKKI